MTSMEIKNSKNKCFVSAVVYIHNNTQSEIENFFNTVINKIYENFENFEVVLVCDDDSLKDPKSLKKSPSMMISKINLAYYQGLEAAMCAGDDLAVGDFVFEFDSIKVNYDADLVIRVFEKSREGYDVVFAGDSNISLSSKLFYKLFNRNKKKLIKHDTFRIVSRRVLNRVKRMNTNIRYRKYQYVTTGLPYDFIEYKPINDSKIINNSAEKSYRLNSGISYMMMYTKVIEKITLTLCLVFLLLTIAVGVWAIYSLFYDANLVSGWVSLIGVMSFGFFGVFLLIMFLIKYMNIILEINTKKVDYIVENVDKL